MIQRAAIDISVPVDEFIGLFCPKADIVTMLAWSLELAESVRIRDPNTVLNTTFQLICESDLGRVLFDSENVLRQIIAVGYCWRYDDDAWPADASQFYAPCPLSVPFVEAVLAEHGVRTGSLRRDDDFSMEGIWVDQMCIRQDDMAEKQ
jgi:hypothetical protein